MNNTVIISDCKNPWIYWWLGLPPIDQRLLKLKHFPKSGRIIHTRQVEMLWRRVRPGPLEPADWLKLADNVTANPSYFTRTQEREIWRQVYRIASEKI
jgi:hypothetical protein